MKEKKAFPIINMRWKRYNYPYVFFSDKLGIGCSYRQNKKPQYFQWEGESGFMLLHWLEEKHVKAEMGIRTDEGWRRMIRKFFCLHWGKKGIILCQ